MPEPSSPPRLLAARLVLFAAVLIAAPAGAAEFVARGEPVVWQDAGEDFGGLSGLVMDAGGGGFWAVSDHGTLYHADVARDASGAVAGVATGFAGRLLDSFGKPVEGFTGDAEALSRAPDGRFYVGYESYTRVTGLDPPDLHPVSLHRWDRFRDFWGNAGFEGLAARPGGGLVAVVEEARDGAYLTFVDGPGDWRPGPAIPAAGGYAASDATFGPDGRFYLLERRLSWTGRFSTRIRRFAYDGTGFSSGETLLETAPGTLSNMEGMSLWTDSRGRTVATLIADNNFLPLAETLVAEYELVQ